MENLESSESTQAGSEGIQSLPAAAPTEQAETAEEAQSSESLSGSAAPLSAFEIRRRNRIDRLRERADRTRREGEMRFKRADEIGSHIPPGQPILVGHHSEKRHRKDLDRIHTSMSKGFSLMKKAERLEQRAASAESNDAIFTEDPQATEKLSARIETLEKEQATMKEVNRRLRAGKSLSDLGISPQAEAKLKTPDFLGRVGFPDYELKNNNANIRRLKARLEAVRKVQSQDAPADIERNGIRLVENVEMNRVQLFFPGKPSESIRNELKSHGFRWSPSQGCWQRHRSPLATQLAKRYLEKAT